MTEQTISFLQKYFSGKVIPVDKVWDRHTWKGTITLKDFVVRDNRLVVIIYVRVVHTTEHGDGKSTFYISISNQTLPSFLLNMVLSIRSYFNISGLISVQDPSNIDRGFIWQFAENNSCSGRFVNKEGVRISEKQYKEEQKKDLYSVRSLKK